MHKPEVYFVPLWVSKQTVLSSNLQQWLWHPHKQSRKFNSHFFHRVSSPAVYSTCLHQKACSKFIRIKKEAQEMDRVTFLVENILPLSRSTTAQQTPLCSVEYIHAFFNIENWSVDHNNNFSRTVWVITPFFTGRNYGVLEKETVWSLNRKPRPRPTSQTAKLYKANCVHFFVAHDTTRYTCHTYSEFILG